jgi:hypothetical protein
MRRRVLVALAVVAASAVAATAGPAPPLQVGGLTALPDPSRPGPNRLQNPGFEARRTGGGVAEWTVKPGGDAAGLDTVARSGGASLRLGGGSADASMPTAEQTVTLDPGLYTLEAWVRTQDVGGADPRAGVRLCLDGRPRQTWWKCTDVVRGTADWKPLRQTQIAVNMPGPYRVTLGPYYAATGTVWLDDVGLARAGQPALDAYLLYPNFKGLLFDDKPQVVRVALAAGERADGAGRMRVSLVDEATNAVGPTRELPVSRERVTVELDAGALASGAYRLRVELLDGGGAVVTRHPDYRVVKAPAGVRSRMSVWYDERNVAHLQNKPAFVLGLYTTSGYGDSPDAYARPANGWGTARMAEAPINMLINYWLGAAPLPALNAYMDDLSRRGISYLHTVNFYYRESDLYKTIPYPAAREGGDALNRWVATTLGRHRGLGGFYTADERPADDVPRVFRQYRELRQALPGSVSYAVLGNGWEGQAALWRDAVDVLGLDPYPLTKRPGQNHLALVGEWTRLGQQAVMGSRPLWMVIQYFPQTSESGWPTRDDLRTMSWMAIVDGARGLLYWSFGNRGLAWVKDPQEKERHWADLVQVTREIKALEPVLLAPDAVVATLATGGEAVRSLGKRGPDGARYLFVYNATAKPMRTEWTLAEPAAEATELSGGAVALEGGRLATALGPYEVKRFRFR